MELPAKINFVDLKLKNKFERLEYSSFEEKRLYYWLVHAFEEIEKNSFCGIQIPKKLIPKDYLKKYKINNLWKYNLSEEWRLLYSIENQEIMIVAIILEWRNHKDYERKFNY